MDEIGFTRRSLVQVGGAVAAGAMLGGASMAAPGPGYDPRRSSAGLVKLEAFADGRPAPWWYTGTIYAVRERAKPRALFHFEGCETYWATPGPTGDAKWQTRTLTFFRDLESRAWLDTFANPFTGQRNTLRPNMLSGEEYLPADGSPPLPRSMQAKSEIAPQGYDAIDPNKAGGSYHWVVAGDMILRAGDRSSTSRVQPSMECQSTFGDSAAFFDPRVKSMSARFSSTTFSPYMGWMGMGDEPGHLVWHAAGLKFSGFAKLPPEYRARAEAVMPGKLTAPLA